MAKTLSSFLIMLSKRASLTRKEKSLFVVTVVLCVGVGLFGYLSATPEVKISAPSPLPSQNAYTFYLAAQNSTKASRIPVDALLDDYAAQRTNEEKMWLYSLPRRQAWLKSNANIGLTIHKGQSLPYRFPLNSWDDYYSGKSQIFWWALSPYKVIEARAYSQESKTDKALESALDLVEIAGHITHGSLYRGRDVEKNLLGIARTLIQENLEKASISDLKHTSIRLNELINKREPYQQALEDWRNRDLDQILKSMSGRPNENNDGLRTLPLGNAEAWRKYYLGCSTDGGIVDAIFYSFSKRSFIVNMEHCFNAAQLDESKPYSTKSSIPDVWYLRGLKSRLSDFRLDEGKILTQRRILQLSLALELFKKQQGKYPQKLDELLPQILKSLPTDPFSPTKSTFRFKNLGKSYLLYSVGKNSMDDMGKFSGYDSKLNRDSDDIVLKYNTFSEIPSGTKPKKPNGKAPLFPVPFNSSQNLPPFP